MESHEFEISVERKNATYLFTFHQDKRNTIGEADTLISIFTKILQCVNFIFLTYVFSSDGSMMVVRSIASLHELHIHNNAAISFFNDQHN